MCSRSLLGQFQQYRITRCSSLWRSNCLSNVIISISTRGCYWPRIVCLSWDICWCCGLQSRNICVVETISFENRLHPGALTVTGISLHDPNANSGFGSNKRSWMFRVAPATVWSRPWEVSICHCNYPNEPKPTFEHTNKGKPLSYLTWWRMEPT